MALNIIFNVLLKRKFLALFCVIKHFENLFLISLFLIMIINMIKIYWLQFLDIIVIILIIIQITTLFELINEFFLRNVIIIILVI